MGISDDLPLDDINDPVYVFSPEQEEYEDSVVMDMAIGPVLGVPIPDRPPAEGDLPLIDQNGLFIKVKVMNGNETELMFGAGQAMTIHTESFKAVRAEIEMVMGLLDAPDEVTEQALESLERQAESLKLVEAIFAMTAMAKAVKLPSAETTMDLQDLTNRAMNRNDKDVRVVLDTDDMSEEEIEAARTNARLIIEQLGEGKSFSEAMDYMVEHGVETQADDPDCDCPACE